MKAKLYLCVLVLTTNLMFAQEEPHHSPFGCSGHAVELSLEPNPPLKFVALDGLPPEAISYGSQHEFRFHGAGPFASITFHLAATVAEQQAGRAFVAKLAVYAATTEENSARAPMQFWQLASTAKRTAGDGQTSGQLLFDANRVAACFRAEDSECNFAELALATPDSGIPLFDISFTQDLGGANAGNWQEAHILMDFRSSPPRVLVTADCAYNEGGGACTAIDSGMAPRSDLQCDWAGEKNDFLCSEIMDPEGTAHRDYYLLSDARAPLRNGEVETLGEAAERLKAQPKTSVKVRGVGAVAWVGEMELASREKVIVLGSQLLDSGARFYFIPESQGRLGTPVILWPHDLVDDHKPSRGTLGANDWTVDQGISFISRPLYEDTGLTVLQVVAKFGWNRLYWVGVGKGQQLSEIDVVELAGGSRYGNCGNYDIPASVVAVKAIQRPFRAALQVQPATVTSEGDARPIAWSSGGSDGSDADGGEPAGDCLRPGELRWVGGKFQSTVEEVNCKRHEKPAYVQVDNTGEVKLRY
jgi:hypothetical protein